MDLNELNASKLDSFRAAINKEADDEIAMLTKKLRENRDAAGKAKAEAAAREEEAKLRAEENAAAAYFRKENSRSDFEATKSILAHRAELVDNFFTELRGDLQEFTKSDKYRDYLKKALAKADKQLEDYVVIAAPKDAEMISAMTDKTVKTDSSIIIGGICAVDEKKGLFFDYTIDEALSNERDNFTDKPELRL